MATSETTGEPRLHRSLDRFFGSEAPDVLDKCRAFHRYAEDLRELGIYQAQYRVVLLSPLDHRVVVRDPWGGPDRELICFDSNSYLGLHLHPRVKARVQRVVEAFGVGTPSAQVLGGTNRYLIELEELMAAVHRRDDALIYPSGYQANVGILTGLLRDHDLVLADQLSHASVHDGCRFSAARQVLRYRHRDVDHLEALIAEHRGPRGGILVVSDGLFSMHGDLAPLPELIAACERQGARLMIDDAHSLGILGATGRGIEEHFGVEGRVPLFMGTFSKAPGAIGGYIAADAATVDYLRFVSRASMFTASLPAATCAGLAEAVRVMHDEPEHRERLWHNARHLWNGLWDAGLQLRPLTSPIIPVHVGDERVMAPLSVAVFRGGVKAGVAQFPAVAHGESMLRLTVCSRHTREDLDQTIALLAALGERFGILRGQASSA